MSNSLDDFSDESDLNNGDGKITYARFNQDSTCLAIGRDGGFGIYNCNPFSWACERNLAGRTEDGIHIIEMMYRSNIIAIVGEAASDAPNIFSDNNEGMPWQDNVLVIWDDKKGTVVAQLVFSGPIRNVRLLRKIIVVALDEEVYVYKLENVELLDTIDTYNNPQGLCAVSSNGNLSIVVYPALENGVVGVKIYQSNPMTDAIKRIESFGIKAHRSRISNISLCSNGMLLTTVSYSGAFLRLWNVFTGQRLQEFKLRIGRANVTFCQLSHDTKYMHVVDSKNNLSIFKIKLKAAYDNPKVTCMTDVRLFTGYVIKKCIQSTKLMMDAQREFAKYRTDSPIIASTFLPNTNNILIVLEDRSVLRLRVSGKLKLLATHSL